MTITLTNGTWLHRNLSRQRGVSKDLELNACKFIGELVVLLSEAQVMRVVGESNCVP